jgi:hypothetical protein
MGNIWLVESSISFQLPSFREMQADGAHDLFNLVNEPDGNYILYNLDSY